MKGSMGRYRRYSVGIKPHTHTARLENPDIIPGFIYVEPPRKFGAVKKRGGPFFDQLADLGYNVARIPAEPLGEPKRIPIFRPWTFLYMPVPVDDTTAWFADLPRERCSVILDCHFPIMNLEYAIADEATLAMVAERRPQILANLAAADAVTVPRGEWAAPITEVNPSVWLLPDINRATDVVAFTLRFNEICAAVVAAARGKGEQQ